VKQFLFILIVGVLFSISSVAQIERRTQIWNRNEIIVKPWKKFSINFSEKIQYNTRSNTLDSKYGDLFLYHKPLEWLDYGAGFRVSSSNTNSELGWLQENRTMVVLDFNKRFNDYKLKFSNRIEYRSFKSDLDHFRYKQSLTATFPSITSWGMAFYTSEETFHKLNGVGMHLIRWTGGVNGIQKDHFQLKIYYAYEKYKLIESWNASDILGINLSLLI